MKNWTANVHDRVSVSVSMIGETNAISDTHVRTLTYTYIYAPVDGFSCEIGFAVCKVSLLNGISFNDRFLHLWIALFANSKMLLLQQIIIWSRPS